MRPAQTRALRELRRVRDSWRSVASALPLREPGASDESQRATRDGSGVGLNAAGPSGRLYPGHVPLSFLQRQALTLGAAVGALTNPARADLVAALGETTGRAALSQMHTWMLQNPEGQRVLRERPRVTDETLEMCWNLPDGTFGKAYAQFMGVRRFSPEERPPVRFVDDPELAYVATRYREVHDLWHVLFGCDTNVLGELALKAVEFVQTGLPMAGLAVVGGPWKLPAQQRALLSRVYLPWAIRSASNADRLICLHYEEHFDKPLEVVRAMWRIMPAPSPAEAQLAGLVNKGGGTPA